MFNIAHADRLARRVVLAEWRSLVEGKEEQGWYERLVKGRLLKILEEML